MIKNPDNSIFRLRYILGLTQAEFAESIGVSESLVKDWENPKRPCKLTNSNAEHIAFVYGVRPESLMDVGLIPTYFNGEPYKKEYHDEWQRILNRFSLEYSLKYDRPIRLLFGYIRRLNRQHRVPIYWKLIQSFYDAVSEENITLGREWADTAYDYLVQSVFRTRLIEERELV